MSRIINVNKSDLIEKIKANKQQHIIDYQQALIDYKEEALKQLKFLLKKANNGDTNIRLNLIQPVDKTEEYDKLILMFTMEVETIVQLESREFNQYVHDDTDFAREAKFANSSYFKG
jgi:hypothetical protein